MSYHLAVSDIHEIEINKLRKRKYIMHGIIGFASSLIIFWYLYYYTKACSNRDKYEKNE